MTNELAIRILTGDVLGTSEQTKEAVTMAVKALSQPDVPDTSVGDSISRQAAIDALWKALFKYEDDTEKQFQESDELDLSEWMVHRIFVQNMSDIDRQTIRNLPSAQPEILACGEGELNVTDTNVGDTISRQAAIDAAIKADMKNNNGILSEKRARVFDEYISNLPSVQPEVTEEAVKEYCRKRCLCIVDSALLKKYASAQPEIIRCKDCKYFVSDMEWCEADDEHPAEPDAFCSWAERRDG